MSHANQLTCLEVDSVPQDALQANSLPTELATLVHQSAALVHQLINAQLVPPTTSLPPITTASLNALLDHTVPTEDVLLVTQPAQLVPDQEPVLVLPAPRDYSLLQPLVFKPAQTDHTTTMVSAPLVTQHAPDALA